MIQNQLKLSIIIPAYNEAATIHHILNKIRTVTLPDGISNRSVHCEIQ